MMQKCDEFDRGLVLYLRVIVAQFLKYNEHITIHGLPITQILDTASKTELIIEHNSVADYV